ncbi:MAG: hypothetical protein WC676_01560 [Candidatus Omnitrophota bacterium]
MAGDDQELKNLKNILSQADAQQKDDKLLLPEIIQESKSVPLVLPTPEKLPEQEKTGSEPQEISLAYSEAVLRLDEIIKNFRSKQT